MAEDLNWGGDDWTAKNYTAKEWDHKASGGKGGPKKKIGLPDEKKRQAEYRNNYENTFGHK